MTLLFFPFIHLSIVILSIVIPYEQTVGYDCGKVPELYELYEFYVLLDSLVVRIGVTFLCLKV